ncbi:DUF4395 domain-containing protein [Jeotgalibacillus campisalis]|uniref:DUF4395 domain-containing protein n=1 Tax=Jeotgalibacillus campisalis TaxID=220754 RepID=A0A0C2SFD5_9BACL|nr:DUF4395 domain-containing protein [Jeotgalibacillus campisalis]KIL52619.1 hypothetical protein KR50_05480 [Jeotgalibacillus campisalis]
MTASIAAGTVPRPLVRVNQWTIILTVILTWVTGQFWLLLLPLAAGLGGIIFDFNPIMRIAKGFLRKPINTYIPEDKSDQKFNQIIASVFLTGGFFSFLVGWTFAGFVFTIMVATAAFVAILGFCVGCFIRFQWKQWQYRRSSHT